MADALQTLMGLSSPSNATPSAYTPNISRNNVRIASIRKFMGLPGEDDGSNSQADYESALKAIQDEQAQTEREQAELKTLPVRVQGEYGLAGDRIKADATVRAAQETGNRLAMQLGFRGSEGQANRDSRTENAQTSQQAAVDRAVAAQKAQAARQLQSENAKQAQLIDTGKVHVPRPADESLLSRWLTGPSQSTLDQQESARLRSGGGVLATGGGDDLSLVASDYIQHYGNLPDDQLFAVIQKTQPTATPEEHQAILHAVTQMRGR